jgi:hypothetical protein
MTSLWSRLRKLFVSDANRKSKRAKRPRARSFSGGRFEQLESRELLTVTYHGGALLTHVEAQNVYLGSDWATNSSLTSQAASLDGFTGYLVNSPYMDMLSSAGYNVGRGSSSTGATLNLSLNKTTTGLTDQQIQADIQAGITGKQLQAPDTNRLYIVYVEPGVVVKLGSDSSRTGFLGYHGAFAGRTANGASADVRYDVLPYPGTPNPTPGSQGYSNAMDELTSVTSHELAEAVTDPDVNYKSLGWYDDRLNGEIGDLTGSETRLNGYLVQNVVGKNDQVITPVTSGGGGGGTGGGGGGGTITLSPPTNVVASATSPTSATISWTGSAGAGGYRIVEVFGSTASVIGTLGSSATSATISNLTAGSTVTFKVEAFSGTTVADSPSVSLTLPTPPPTTTLAAPQVTGSAASSTTISLSWNSVTGAQGYRLYWWNGFRAVLIGTVGASTTSVTVVGVLPGSTSQLLVQAFAGNAVANSQWITVATPRRTVGG